MKCKRTDCNNNVKENNIYCSTSCRTIYTNQNFKDYSKTTEYYSNIKENKKIDYLLNPKHCPECKNIINYEKRSSKFCRQSCSTIFHNKLRKGKKKKSLSKKGLDNILQTNKLRSKNLKIQYDLTPNKCIICQSKIEYDKRHLSSCSLKCRHELLKNIAFENNFGGETNYKKYIYKDQYFDSNWEIKVAKYLDENNIIWIRSRSIKFTWIDTNNIKRRYYPDFYLPDYNIYLDPKNQYKLSQDLYKLTYVIEKYKIKLIYGDVDYIINCISNLKLTCGITV